MRGTLLAWVLFPLTLLFAADAVFCYGLAFQFADLAYDRALASEAIALAGRVRLEGGLVRVDVPAAALQVFEVDELDRRFYRVSDDRGDFVFGHRELASPPSDPLRGGKPMFYDSRFLGEPLRLAAVAVPLAGSEASSRAIVAVGETLVKRRILAREILVGMLLPQVILLALAAVLVWFGVARGLRPLEALADAIRRRSHRDLSPLEERTAPQEVRPMVGAINGLLERLGATLAAQRRFVADAAHQLRTPLAGLKTQTELALRERDPAAVLHSLAQIQSASERSAHLVNQLLALARAEPGADRPDRFQSVDVNQLAKETTSDWVAAALKKSIDLGFEGAARAANVTGDAVLLRELISNLLDNAVRYTPGGGRVTVRVKGEALAISLSVEDDGPGIAVAERERVFERFHRILGTGQEGCGLGLAIVREIVERHHADVSVNSGADGRGTLVAVCFRPG
ncbi:MAG: sensor histidine kinase N-terminal domain-containing protein [Burkholderiales bacterium]